MPKLELEKLKGSIVAMGQMCEYIVMTAMTALMDRDAESAAAAKSYDNEIDEMELLIDRQCRNLLISAAAKLEKNDINFILSVHRTNNDMERIGDQAVQIANHALFLLGEKSILADVVDFLPMFEDVGEMIRESVVALLENDPELAWKITDDHLRVNESFQLIFREAVTIMRRGPAMIERASHILFIAQAIQRIADLTVNIAEEVVFVSEGKNIRHHIGEYRPMPTAENPAEIAVIEKELAAKKSDSAHASKSEARQERLQKFKSRAKKIAPKKK